MVLVELIESLNQTLSSTNPGGKIVVVGPSMGGLISRYALTWMESQNMTHNVRLWASFDSPHKGANIPIGDQYFLKYFAGRGAVAAQDAIDDQLNSNAAKQMLLHHFEATYYSGSTVPAGHPTHRSTWQNKIEALGWPGQNNIRRIALLNGAINGAMDGDPCMHVVEMKAQLMIRWFFIKWKTIKVGSGDVNFTGDYGNACQVFTGWRFTALSAKTLSAAAPSASKSFDIVPGSWYEAQKDLLKGQGYDPLLGTGYTDIGLGAFAKISVMQETHTFIPTMSALGLDILDQNFNVDVDLSQNLEYKNVSVNCTGESPFHNYFAPEINEEHVLLTNANVAWIKKELHDPNQSGYAPDYFQEKPAVLTFQQTDCDEIQLTLASPTATSFSWSSGFGNLLYNGTSTTATTSTPQISGNITTTGQETAAVSYLNSCSVTTSTYLDVRLFAAEFQFGNYFPLFTWEHLLVSVDAFPSWVTNYNWYINNNLVKSGANATSYGSNEGTNYIECGENTLRLEVETDCGTFIAAETTFEQLCGGRAQEIEMFPNPSSSQLTLRVKDQKIKDKVVITITSVRIYDKLGNLMLYRNVEGGSTQVSLDISRLPADIYKVEVWDKNKKVTLTLRKN